MNITVDTRKSGIDAETIAEYRTATGEALDRLWSGREPMTGWVSLPAGNREEELEYILNMADAVKHQAELFVVAGIGGSYLGAKAAIEALPKTEGGIPVRFIGNSFCTDSYLETIEEIKKRKTVLCVISKSGSTMEVTVAYEVLKPLMAEQYGSEEEAAKHIIAITDASKGPLREEAERRGMSTLEIPDSIGGRYSVLTAAGLLPMAVSGIDVRAMMAGAGDCANSPRWDDDATDYAVIRHAVQQQGKEAEFIAMCQSRLVGLGEWINQLYGESEGKEGSGLLPATLEFSTDLHSMGQYIQEGRQIFMETLIVVDEPMAEITVPGGSLKGKTVRELNEAMVKGVVNAHSSAGIPIVEIHVPKLDAYNYGQLIYFLETTCAITAMLSGVNPFDQPGVERYKSEMRKLL